MTGTVLEEGLRGAGGHLLNGTHERFMLARYDPRARAGHARHRLALHVRGDARWPHHAGTAGSTSRWGISAPTRSPSSSRAWSSAAPTAASTWPADWSRWCRRRTTSWAALYARSTPPPSCPVCSWPAKMPAACTAPTGSAATVSPTRPCSAASPARRWPPGLRANAPTARAGRGRYRRGVARAQHPFTRSGGDLNRLRERLLDIMWDDVGVIRDAARIEAGPGQARRDRARAARHRRGGRRPRVQSDLARLAEPALARRGLAR